MIKVISTCFVECIQCFRDNSYNFDYYRRILTCKYCGIEIPIPKERKKCVSNG